MACFIVPAVEAAVVTAIKHNIEKHADTMSAEEKAQKLETARKIGWLGKLLCGGSALLAFEHLAHGEVVPWFPFLTALSDKAETATMLHEMATAGVGMAVLVTVVWFGMVKAAEAIKAREVTE